MDSLATILKNLSPEEGKITFATEDDLKKIQTRLLGVLDDIVDCCERHDIDYQLSGGSVLGAIRHQGFIPWDDDIDINMLREDADKFIPFFREEYKDKYWIHVPGETEGFDYLVIRILTKDVHARVILESDKEQCGLGIDIFVMENTPNNPFLRKVHGYGYMVFRYILSCIRFYRNKEDLYDLFGDNVDFKAVAKHRINFGRFFSLFPVRFWIKKAQWWAELCKNNSSKFVAIGSGTKHYFGEMYEREKMCKTQLADFEGRKLKISADYDHYMKVLYRDYMTIPPKEKREQHAFLELDREALAKYQRQVKDT